MILIIVYIALVIVVLMRIAKKAVTKSRSASEQN